jgi:hypothetical protein
MSNLIGTFDKSAEGRLATGFAAVVARHYLVLQLRLKVAARSVVGFGGARLMVSSPV